jgi:protein-S-isoprenylcysteine O-methyltransferase Ste14
MAKEMGFLAIFQPAGLAFFLVVFLGRTLILWLKQEINPFVLGTGKKGLHRLFEMALFPWLVLWILEILAVALHSPFQLIPASWNPLLLNNLLLKIAGALLIVFGDFVFVWALISFGNSWRVGIDGKKAGNLVTGGVFAFSRNPIFVFLDLYFIGTFLINGTLVFLIFAGVTALGIHYQILQEEKFLAGKYAQAYWDYCSRTSRYISLKKGRQT